MRRGSGSYIRAITFVAFFFTLLGLPVAGQAKYAALIVDADTGEVHHAVNAETRNFPASLTKLMTLYLTFEAIEKGTVTFDTKLTASSRAARQPASRLGLKKGDTITVKKAILALIVKSANDVATVIAESLADSEREFALHMTAKARDLGMTRTTFRNASGLPNRGQMSTATDMATLSRHIMNDFPQYYDLFATPYFSYNGRTYRTHNKLIGRYEGADGLKTGYIRASGFNLVASAVRNGHRLIGVVFGGRTSRTRDRHMIRLLNKAFATIASRRPPAMARYDADSIPTPGVKPLAELIPLPKRKTIVQAAPEAVATVTPKEPPAREEKETAVAKVMPKEPPARDDKESAAAKERRDVWGIQVGAFRTEKPARETAEAISARLPNLLDGGEVFVVPLKKKRGRVLYRARILGIEKRNAYRACRALKKEHHPCMELRISQALEIAESTG